VAVVAARVELVERAVRVAPAADRPVLRGRRFAELHVARPVAACRTIPAAPMANRSAPVSAVQRTSSVAATIAVNVAESAVAPVAVHGASNVLMARARLEPRQAAEASLLAHLVAWRMPVVPVEVRAHPVALHLEADRAVAREAERGVPRRATRTQGRSAALKADVRPTARQ
jgi:hypothetical protein